MRTSTIVCTHPQVALSSFNPQFCTARREYFDVRVALDIGCRARSPRLVDGLVLAPTGQVFEVCSPM